MKGLIHEPALRGDSEGVGQSTFEEEQRKKGDRQGRVTTVRERKGLAGVMVAERID